MTKSWGIKSWLPIQEKVAKERKDELWLPIQMFWAKCWQTCHKLFWFWFHYRKVKVCLNYLRLNYLFILCQFYFNNLLRRIIQYKKMAFSNKGYTHSKLFICLSSNWVQRKEHVCNYYCSHPLCAMLMHGNIIIFPVFYAWACKWELHIEIYTMFVKYRREDTISSLDYI